MISPKEFDFSMCARDADNLRAVKQTFNADGSVAKLVTSVRGGLDALADLTTNVNNSSSTYQPFQQKNYLYGPGGLIASELRGFYRSGKPVWQIYGSATGCNASATPAAAQNLQSTGYDLFLSFGGCSSATVKTLTLEWHELNADGTPRNCVASSMQTDATTNFNARYSCGILHLNPALGTETIFKLKYDVGYSIKATAHANLGLLGERDFVTGNFTVKLARGATADQLAFVTNTSPATQSAAAPPPGPDTPSNGAGPRFVEYYQKDHLGTIRVVSNESGAVLSTHDYEPFGLELPGEDPSSNTHRFTGHERDTETGLDYMKARYYGASMGRFSAVDIIGINNVRMLSPVHLNRYVYGSNNPVLMIDPTGKYDEVGHYYVSFVVAIAAGLTPAQAGAFARAAWAPDTDSRSATSYQSLFGQSAFTNQQNIHLLNGRPALQEQAKALANLNYMVAHSDMATFSTIGEDIAHSWGDANAHVNDFGYMYSVLKGHTWDSLTCDSPDNIANNLNGLQNYIKGEYAALNAWATANGQSSRLSSQGITDLIVNHAANTFDTSDQKSSLNAFAGGLLGDRNFQIPEPLPGNPFGR